MDNNYVTHKDMDAYCFLSVFLGIGIISLLWILTNKINYAGLF